MYTILYSLMYSRTEIFADCANFRKNQLKHWRREISVQYLCLLVILFLFIHFQRLFQYFSLERFQFVRGAFFEHTRGVTSVRSARVVTRQCELGLLGQFNNVRHVKDVFHIVWLVRQWMEWSGILCIVGFWQTIVTNNLLSWTRFTQLLIKQYHTKQWCVCFLFWLN